jgi:hypothetical protein
MQQVASGVAAEVEAAGKRARVGVVCEGLFFQINGSGRRRWQREVKMAAGGADGSGRCRWQREVQMAAGGADGTVAQMATPNPQ